LIGSSVVHERLADRTAAARIRLFEEIGAKVGLQLAAKQIVFLEGEDSRRDQRVLERLIGMELPGVAFVASGPSAGVLGAGTRAGLLLEQASHDARFLMALDRDYREDADVESMRARFRNRVFVWNCHEIENLLLSPAALLFVVRSYGKETISDEATLL